MALTIHYIHGEQSVSPELLECQNLELAVPGTYRAGILIFLTVFWCQIWCAFQNLYLPLSFSDSPVVTIASFATQLVVITSKQRPRKLTIHGSDGEDHAFLLKGHEDLRQDERVMQVLSSFDFIVHSVLKLLCGGGLCHLVQGSGF